MTLVTYFIILFILTMAYVILGNYISYKAMHALDVPPALLPSGQFKQMREYRELLEKEENRPWFMFFLKNNKLILCFYAVLYLSFIIMVVLNWLKST